MKKSKYRIYTITPCRKIKGFVIGFFGICVLFMAISHVPKPNFKVYDIIAKNSINSVFMRQNKSEFLFSDLKGIKIHTLMNQLSPVFADSEKSVALNNTKETHSLLAGTVMAKEKAQKVNAKSVVSSVTDIKNETEYTPDAESLINLPRTYLARGSEPKVLIVHTHGCETYSNLQGFGLGKNGEYRTTDTQHNMVKTGEVIAKVFKDRGINVIHDKTLCDYPKYNSSYVKSLEVIETNLQKYPSIEFVFDIHRDAVVDKDGTTPTKLVCQINGETTAQAMIVCGTDSMGLENPHWQENLALALKIQKTMEKKYPGLMRPVNLRKERFNMHKTKGSLLFEVGTHGNTQEEALKCAQYLADGIAETIG